MGRLGLAVLLVLALGPACHRRPGRVPVSAPAPPLPGAIEEGVASWYGHPYHGRRASNGEIYDMEKFTAAHRTLPFGARVRVESLSNGRAVEVRINDRGPFVHNRIIDLSRAAAREIQMIGPGTARVRVRVVGLPEAVPGGFFAVQVGSFRDRSNAERLRRTLERECGAASIQIYDSPGGIFYRVLAGSEREAAGAEALAERLRGRDLTGFVVRLDENQL